MNFEETLKCHVSESCLSIHPSQYSEAYLFFASYLLSARSCILSLFLKDFLMVCPCFTEHVFAELIINEFCHRLCVASI